MPDRTFVAAMNEQLQGGGVAAAPDGMQTMGSMLGAYRRGMVDGGLPEELADRLTEQMADALVFVVSETIKTGAALSATAAAKKSAP